MPLTITDDEAFEAEDYGEGYEGELPADLADSDFEDDAEGADTTFEVHGRTYEIVLTKRRLDLYEQRHKPVMASFIQNDGAFSVAELTDILAYGLRLVDGPYVNPRRGMEMAERLVSTNGYAAVLGAVMAALQRDCGFLFMGA